MDSIPPSVPRDRSPSPVSTASRAHVSLWTRGDGAERYRNLSLLLPVRRARLRRGSATIVVFPPGFRSGYVFVTTVIETMRKMKVREGCDGDGMGFFRVSVFHRSGIVPVLVFPRTHRFFYARSHCIPPFPHSPHGNSLKGRYGDHHTKIEEIGKKTVRFSYTLFPSPLPSLPYLYESERGIRREPLPLSPLSVSLSFYLSFFFQLLVLKMDDEPARIWLGRTATGRKASALL